eukprot:TRINITY_DN4078_c0_g1_i1.p1 TRINITY_DN4078_c0_g1~~TRINITY_DN4078_c0_g1_i1.p1  ORF type:complete len:474 (+),score=74.84 TRINITY_DN4078_c0_g1_i1:74-1495(+)
MPAARGRGGGAAAWGSDWTGADWRGGGSAWSSSGGGSNAKTSRDDDSISRALSKVLRYEVGQHGTQEDSEGFVKLGDLLALPSFKGCTMDQVVHAATTSAGGRGPRFQIEGDRIKALYGRKSGSESHRGRQDGPPRGGGEKGGGGKSWTSRSSNENNVGGIGVPSSQRQCYNPGWNGGGNDGAWGATGGATRGENLMPPAGGPWPGGSGPGVIGPHSSVGSNDPPSSFAPHGGAGSTSDAPPPSQSAWGSVSGVDGQGQGQVTTRSPTYAPRQSVEADAACWSASLGDGRKLRGGHAVANSASCGDANHVSANSASACGGNVCTESLRASFGDGRTLRGGRGERGAAENASLGRTCDASEANVTAAAATARVTAWGSGSEDISTGGGGKIGGDSGGGAVAAATDPRGGEVWKKFICPTTSRHWHHSESTGEHFFEDDAAEAGWRKYKDNDGKDWWWHEANGRFFYETDLSGST